MTTSSLAISNIIFYLLLAIAFCLPLIWSISSGLLWLALALAIIDVLKNPPRLNRLQKSNYFFIAWAIIAGLTIFNSPRHFESAYNYMVLMGQYFSVFLLTSLYTDSEKKFWKMLQVIFLAGGLVAIIAVYQYFFGIVETSDLWVDTNKFPELKNRAYATLYNPNILAAYFLLIIPLGLGIFFNVQDSGQKKVLLFILVLFSGALVLTFSRGAWLSLLVTVLLYSLFCQRKLLWLFLVGGGTAFIFAHRLIITRLLSAFNPNDTSAEIRGVLWHTTYYIIKENLLGIGWGAYRFVYPTYDYFFFENNPAVIIYHAHNSYLHIATETGLLGLFLFILTIGLQIKLAYGYIKYTDSRKKGFVIGFLLSMLTILLFAFTDHPLFNIEITVIFWQLNGLLVGFSYFQKRKNLPKDNIL